MTLNLSIYTHCKSEMHPITFDPSRCADKTTYAVQEIAIARGDQLRWTRNDRERGLRNGQLVKVEETDTNGTATLKSADGQETTLNLSGQQYLDYALVSTTYSSQGKTAERVLVVADGTLSKEGLYVAVSRAKTHLSLYTADKEKLFKQAERSSAKENPSDYLTLFNLVNPDAQNEKTARTARELHRSDRAEHIRDRVGAVVAVGHAAAVRRDRSNAPRDRQFERTAAGLNLGVRADAAESHRASEDVGRELEAFIDRQQQRVAQTDERRRYRKIYRQYAEQVGGGIDVYDQDKKVAKQLLVEILQAKNGRSLSLQDKQLAESIMQESPEAKQIMRTDSRAAAHEYAVSTLKQAKQGLIEQSKQVKRSQQRDRGGMER